MSDFNYTNYNNTIYMNQNAMVYDTGYYQDYYQPVQYVYTYHELPPPTPSPSSSCSTQNDIKSTEERVKETIARASTVPAEFFQTEFLDYSEQQLAKKRKRAVMDDVKAANRKMKTSQKEQDADEPMDTNEIRRQIHIQSEQKRRAQIKDGFDELKNHLPGCSNKKLSKAALLTRTVQQLEYMKKMQDELLAEVERLAKENAGLKSLTPK